MIAEFPLIKNVDSDEALAVAERQGAKLGVLMFEDPCGSGRIKVIEIGEPDAKDILLWAKNLEAFAMEMYLDEVEAFDEIS